MFIIHSGNEGPICAAYTKVRANDAVRQLSRLRPGERFWISQASEDRVEELGIEVLGDEVDCQVSEEFVAHLTVSGGVVCPVLRRSRTTLRGLVRTDAMATDGQAQGYGRTKEIAEQNARMALVAFQQA